MKKIVFLIAIIFLVSGCYDYRELNNLGIVAGVALDYKDDNYYVTLEIFNDKKESDSSANEKSYTVNGNGKNVAQAFANTNLKLDRQAYYAHLKIVIISEDIAKNHLEDITDYFIRDQAIRDEFYLLVAMDSEAKDVLDSSTKVYPLTTNRIVSMLENDKFNKNISNTVPFGNVVNKILTKGVDAILTTIYKTSNDNIKFGGLAIFKKFKMVDYLTNQESVTFNLLDSKAKNAEYTQYCNNSKNNFTVSIYDSASEITYKKEKIQVNLKLQGDITQNNCNYDLRNYKVEKKLEEEFAKTIKKQIENLITKTQESDSDILGFNSAYYKKEKKYFSDWRNLDYTVNIDLKINKKGLIFEVHHAN